MNRGCSFGRSQVDIFWGCWKGGLWLFVEINNVVILYVICMISELFTGLSAVWYFVTAC